MMFINMYLFFAIFTIHISHCFCYVSYNQFRGFDDMYHIIRDGASRPPASVQHTTHQNRVTYSIASRMSTIPTSKISKGAMKRIISLTPAVTNTTDATLPPSPLVLPITYPKFNCSEDERPFNIGTYEVPTQRDLVLQIQRTLKRMFSQYREKALDLLQDIQQATKATSDVEKRCLITQHNHRKNYKKCVKEVSRKCELITKSLVMSLERQRADVSAFIEGTICKVTDMRADPVQLIKTLAMEQASLEFALPGFLRLLGSCSTYCDKTHPKMRHKKPIRHMTDQDLVVKHFLTKKSYVQLIN